jgi:hypothetical protein
VATGSEPRGNNQAGKLISPQYTPAHQRPQAAHFRCGDRAAPITAEAARRRLLARSVLAEPRRPKLADIERMLEALPYGRWIARDGRVIIFNRGYQAIWQRLPNGEIQRANGGEWIDWVDQGWFGLGSMRYEKSAREAYRKVLRDFFDGKPLIVKSEI